MVLRKITRGRYTDNLGRRHSIGPISNPPPSITPFYAGCPSCRDPPNLSWFGTGTGIRWICITLLYNTTTTTVLRPFFWHYPGEPVPEENFSTLWYKGRLTDAINHPAGRHSIRTNQCPPPPSPIFYRPDALPAAQPTVSKH